MANNLERIQKVLAGAGYGSRRVCEELVLEGRVSVNGRVVDTLPILVDPNTDDIRVDGQRLKREKRVYYLLHKPKGVLCTNADPSGRIRAVDLLRGVRQRVYPVGRLDMHSTGLLLMTNDGELAARLTHPRYGVEKTYRATVAGKISKEDVDKLRQGVWLSEGKTQSACVKIVRASLTKSLLEIRIREGRNRQIRRMLARLGHKVVSLKRTKIANISIRGLGVGNFRSLTSTEVADLHKVGVSQHHLPKKRTAMTKRAVPRKRATKKARHRS